jgi:hypothetical protein
MEPETLSGGRDEPFGSILAEHSRIVVIVFGVLVAIAASAVAVAIHYRDEVRHDGRASTAQSPVPRPSARSHDPGVVRATRRLLNGRLSFEVVGVTYPKSIDGTFLLDARLTGPLRRYRLTGSDCTSHRHRQASC